MAFVTADQVRNRLGFSATDISDSIVNSFIIDAAAYLSNQVNYDIDPDDCTLAEASAIADLAAIYCYLHKTGVAAVGYTLNLGSITFTGPSSRIAQLEVLKANVQAFIRRNRRSPLRSV